MQIQVIKSHKYIRFARKRFMFNLLTYLYNTLQILFYLFIQCGQKFILFMCIAIIINGIVVKFEQSVQNLMKNINYNFSLS